jgi:zinc D-Ala-D-Ala dipeptidase
VVRAGFVAAALAVGALAAGAADVAADGEASLAGDAPAAGRTLPARAAIVPIAYPAPDAIRAARRFARARDGIVSFALIDSGDREHGLAPNRPYVSASVVKAMLLVAYLRAIGNRLPTPAERDLLGPMITRSSNSRATAVYAHVGAAGLTALAERVGMRSFAVAGTWTSAQITAADQARFFLHIGRFAPARARTYARHLLASVRPYQRWGFTRAAERAGFSAYMKAGWRPTVNGRLVHAVGLFERPGTRVALAILTDGNPSHAYGTATLRGIAKRLFRGRLPGEAAAPGGASMPAARRLGAAAASSALAGSPAHRRAGLGDVHRDAPGIALDIRYATDRNLTGAPLPGYCRPWALLLEPAARDLARVQRRLRRRGLGLEVFDAYRPVRATNALVRWAQRSGRPELVGTYIARRSRHNLGAAVDLTLVRDGRRVSMGSRYDDLSPRAHTYAARGRALRNRLTLRAAMQRFGFAPYDREWWHFEHRGTGGKPLDIPLGCG